VVLSQCATRDFVSPVAIFLSSEASAWIAGEILLVSGGMR
jgi:NAD(P)-dependent dehydrogenase (short-subunit alcohol dehydrogenase family)